RLPPASPARNSKAGKKESMGRRLSQLCPLYAMPSSNSSLDYRHTNARIVENGFATTSGLSKSAKVVIASFTASDLASHYRRRIISPVVVAEAMLARIERLNGRYNAFCLIDGDSALRDAKASEARWMAGTPKSYVDGVPATIKDIVLTRGWPTMRGSRTIDPRQSCEEDAPIVMHLREAGAVLLWKTTTPELRWESVSHSPLYGIP